MQKFIGDTRADRVIAMVGLSVDWVRPSNFAAKYLIEHGYTVIPIRARADS